jgi:hypothetical protein
MIPITLLFTGSITKLLVSVYFRFFGLQLFLVGCENLTCGLKRMGEHKHDRRRKAPNKI